MSRMREQAEARAMRTSGMAEWRMQVENRKLFVQHRAMQRTASTLLGVSPRRRAEQSNQHKRVRSEYQQMSTVSTPSDQSPGK